MSKHLHILAVMLLISLSYSQLAPQVSVTNNILGSITNYKLSYYSSNNLTSSTTFTVNFNQSYLRVNDGVNNCTIRIGGVAVLTPACNCTNRICSFKPMVSSDPRTVEIQINRVTNPLFVFQQTLQVFVYFTPSITYNYSSVIIPANTYQPMSMSINSLKQSDYGVGYTPVSYIFNISLPYISKNMQMQVTIPPQITYTSLSSDLSFYQTIQNAVPLRFQSLLIYNLQIDANSAPNGFLLLNLSGLGNPRFLGNSSSFKITFMETTAVSGCATCKISQIATGLTIQSRVPGDVLAVSIDSSNRYISAINTLSINLQLYAGIPRGGRVSLYLPSQIKPVQPIQCNNIYGFIFPDNNNPTCSYNSTANRIDTVNFATPYFDSTGNGIISLKVVNPLDSRKVSFTFETYDASGRVIGQSRSSSYFNAIPLPMNVTVNKSAVQVDKMFNMSVELVLGQNLNLSNNFIEVVLPALTYNTSIISCISAGQPLSCTKTPDIMQQLVIKFTPPCTQCTAQNTIKFLLTNIKNPAYINQANQMVIVNTRSDDGIIESGQITILLTPANILLSTYLKPTNQPVGTQYQLRFGLGLPDYVRSNGGQIQLVFSIMSVYNDGQVSGQTYMNPSYSLQITYNSSTPITLPNTIQYHDSTPSSISKITFPICQSSSFACPPTESTFTFTIKGLKLGYIPALQSTDIMRITTKYGQILSQKYIDSSSFAPVLYNAPLSVQYTRSITNSFSDVVIKWTSNQVVFDRMISFSLPASVKINGQCMISTTQGFVTSFVCNKVNDNTINVNCDFDSNLMISQTINYSITITNVSTPISTAPLSYTLQTAYNSTKNQRFTTRYQIQTPLQLTLSSPITRTNSTINQQFTLSTLISPITLLYDSYQIILPKLTLITQQDWLSIQSYILTENNTHYILDKRGLVVNNLVEVRGKNNLNTGVAGKAWIGLLNSGFLVQAVDIDVGTNAPVLIACTITMVNRTVGVTTDMTITCDRNSAGELADTAMVIKLPSNGFNYTLATSNSTTISPSLTITSPISSTSPRLQTISIQNLRNIAYIPIPSQSSTYSSNNVGDIQITTIQADATKIVGRGWISSINYIPNDAYDMRNCTAVRNNVKSGEFTNVSITCRTVFGVDGYVVALKLPVGQNGFVSGNSGCVIGQTGEACAIVQSNSTDMQIRLKPNTTITLTKVQNIFPNPNKLSLSILTYPQLQLVQQSLFSITPQISLQPIQVTSRTTSTKVGQISTLTLQLKPTQLKIQSTNILKILIPTKTYTRTFNTDDCMVRLADNSSVGFTGCNYVFQGDWLVGVNVAGVGPYDVQVNATLVVSFGVTNAWAAYNFAAKTIIVTVFKNQTSSTSQGVCLLTSMYTTSTFTLLPISSASSSLTQTSLTSGSLSNLSLSLSLQGNVGKSTRIVSLIPKDTFIFSSSSFSATNNWTLDREDNLYYYISTFSSCVNTSGCKDYTHNVSIGVRNAYFVKKMRNPIIFYASYDNILSSQSYTLSPGIPKPLAPPSLSLSRTSAIGSKQTSINISMTLSQPSAPISGSLTIQIPENLTSQPLTSTFYSYFQRVPLSTSTSFQIPQVAISHNAENTIFTIPAANSNNTNLHSLLVEGKNVLEVPLGVQKYWVLVQNSTHILYFQDNLVFPEKLLPLGDGLIVTRSVTTVGATTQLTLSGTLPTTIPSTYTLSINNTQYPSSSSSSPQLSLTLTPTTNPLTTSQNRTMPISICNQTHCIYRQLLTTITPALTPIYLTTNDVNITMPNIMTISTNYTAVVVFNSANLGSGRTWVWVCGDARVWDGVRGVGVVQVDGTRVADTSGDFTVSIQTGANYQKSIKITPKPSKQLSPTTLQIYFTTPQYQLSLPRSHITLTYQTPTSTLTKQQQILITGTQLKVNLTSTSYKTKELSNYTMIIEILAKVGILSIEIPKDISKLYDNGTNYAGDDGLAGKIRVDIGGVGLGITGTNLDQCAILAGLHVLTYINSTGTFMLNIPIDQTTLTIATPLKITVSLRDIPNPKDNRPLTFIISQHEIQLVPTRIYGYKEIAFTATILDNITLHSAVRNVSKIDAPISLQLDIQTLGTQDPDQMIIKLPVTQVLIKESNVSGTPLSCSICIDGDCTSVTATGNISTNTITLRPHLPGRHNYTISSCLTNSHFSQSPQPSDKTQITLSSPYQTATTVPSTTTYITPIISTGQIKLISFTSSSNLNLDYTTLMFELQPQNYLNCDGLIFVFEELVYYLHAGVGAKVNGVQGGVKVINSSAVFVEVVNKRATLKVEISKVINYIKSGGFVISSLKKKSVGDPNVSSSLLASLQVQFNPSDYGVADQFTSNSSNLIFTPLNAQTRLIFPDPYISSTPKKILAINDFSLPAQLPTSTLRYKFTSSVGCSQDFIFNKTISVECMLSSSGTSTFEMKLFDTKMPSSMLTSFVKSVFIYPEPKQFCNNNLCDVCADGPAGQYCFTCREGLFSDNGQCVQQCPQRSFPYNERTCSECAPSCATCFDAYDNSCLSCLNTVLLLDSGTCRNYCEVGYAFQAKFCVQNDQCTKSEGCRICSPTGFCYECLPDFDGQPKCKYMQILPKNFFIYWMIPVLLLLPIVSLITCIKVGRQTFSHMFIYLLAVIELMSWIFVIPKMPQQALAMIMCAFLLLKIIISIIAYQTYYNKQITLGKQQKLLSENERQSEQKTDNQANSKKSKQLVKNDQIQSDENISHKQRLTRFTAHFLSCDAYQLLMNKLGKPFTLIKHFLPYFVLTILNRVIILCFLIYIISQYKSQGDLLYLPLISIGSGIGILLTRALTSQKFIECLGKLRG